VKAGGTTGSPSRVLRRRRNLQTTAAKLRIRLCHQRNLEDASRISFWKAQPKSAKTHGLKTRATVGCDVAAEIGRMTNATLAEGVTRHAVIRGAGNAVVVVVIGRKGPDERKSLHVSPTMCWRRVTHDHHRRTRQRRKYAILYVDLSVLTTWRARSYDSLKLCNNRSHAQIIKELVS
jgi:hypothetical protein